MEEQRGSGRNGELGVFTYTGQYIALEYKYERNYVPPLHTLFLYLCGANVLSGAKQCTKEDTFV